MSKSIKKMNPAEKATWTSALRSGKFKQGSGMLVKTTNNGVEYCCLGVAQCVLGERAPIEGQNLLRFGRFGLTGNVQEALAAANDCDGGIATVRSSFIKLGVAPPRLNKKGRATFTAIANWVDKNL